MARPSEEASFGDQPQSMLRGARSIEATMSPQKSFPARVIVIGAGVFGLSTAFAIAKRYPATSVTVIDRLTPPVPDGTSVDTTRCIRSGKINPVEGVSLDEAARLSSTKTDARNRLH